MISVDEFVNAKFQSKINEIEWLENRNLIAILTNNAVFVYRLWEEAYHLSTNFDIVTWTSDGTTLAAIDSRSGIIEYYITETGSRLCSYNLELAEGDRISTSKWHALDYKLPNQGNSLHNPPKNAPNLSIFLVGSAQGNISIRLNGSLKLLSTVSETEATVRSLSIVPGSFMVVATCTGSSNSIITYNCSPIEVNMVHLVELADQRQEIEILLTSIESEFSRFVQTLNEFRKNCVNLLVSRMDAAFDEHLVKPDPYSWIRLMVFGDFDDDLIQTMASQKKPLKQIQKNAKITYLKFKDCYTGIIGYLESLLCSINCLENASRFLAISGSKSLIREVAKQEIAWSESFVSMANFVLDMSEGLSEFTDFLLVLLAKLEWN
jgi:hypothetical protein